jgi:hypothetical protein
MYRIAAEPNQPLQDSYLKRFTIGNQRMISYIFGYLDNAIVFRFGVSLVKLRVGPPLFLATFLVNRFVAEPIRDAPVDVTVSVLGEHSHIRNIATGVTVSGETVPTRPQGQMPLTATRTSFKMTIMPHSYVAFAEQ